jgi:hypothetical protein
MNNNIQLGWKWKVAECGVIVPMAIDTLKLNNEEHIRENVSDGWDYVSLHLFLGQRRREVIAMSHHDIPQCCFSSELVQLVTPQGALQGCKQQNNCNQT